jgi:hypothetical protein
MSYAATTTLINTVITDAAFRTWGLAYNAKFASMGLIQTADTGQINWATVLAATVSNTVQGYEIWRFADTLQATAPVYLKIEYGDGPTIGNAAFWIQLGSGSNGSGGLTGILSTRQIVTITTATAGAITHYWSGDTNRITIAAVGAAGASSMLFTLERTVDAAGVLTSEGCLMTFRGSNTWGQVAWNQATGPCTATWEATLGAMGPSLAPFGTFGAQVAVYPVFHNKGVFFPAGLGIFVYESTLITSGSPVAFSVYGATHTYMPLPVAGYGSPARGGFSSPTVMVRYE